VLEGMQFGAPTIASCSSSIPEVAGEAAVLLPPEDTRAWTKAMLELAAQSRAARRDGRAQPGAGGVFRLESRRGPAARAL
jgi:glycosyltransferase involved in cell wall biosynthesis